MSIVLDHTIVHASDKLAAARFFADVFGLQVHPETHHFAQVRVNEHLTFDFADDSVFGESGGHLPQHYAFCISDEKFEAVFARVQARGIAYGSGPFSADDGHINTRRGGRGFYFRDPDGHLFEVMTVSQTASA